ncbi:MAG: hypothetical protein OXP69_18650 [Spirochaetaceae bacterium]|nr:hypothetical protein [Spirochaetaceae bacterium]
MRTVDEAKAESRGESLDMSPEAISRRFDILVELDRVARALASARRPPAQGTPTNASKGATVNVPMEST